MKYFITGITGTVVPVIVENLMKKDPNPVFYFAIRKGKNGTDIKTRLARTIDALDIDAGLKKKLAAGSTPVEINVTEKRLGIDPKVYIELVENTEKILHGAADVRFDQPYEKIRVSNVEFTEKIYSLFADIRDHRKAGGKSVPTLYYISTSYAYGAYKGIIPEDYPNFKPARPDNTYARTKAEAKRFILDRIEELNDNTVIFEPTIIGGSASTGRTKTYNLFYVFLMLGYKGKLPFMTAPENRLDIVPVDWVAGIISDIMSRDEFRQGVIRLASGPDAVTNLAMRDVGYQYYVNHDPDPSHVIPPVRFVPKWVFNLMLFSQKNYHRAMYLLTHGKRHKKLMKGIHILEGYIPYITGNKIFDNSKSLALIEKYTDYAAAPLLQDVADEDGRVKKGYFEKLLADTLETGWGGMVKFGKPEPETETVGHTKAEPALSTARR
ncbi:MAG: NAD-dependent epimerase/dehydratase family protein [Deltaproteobacteria bacterium]|nr:NAD-dependent epimerase/dehydratase family protein [Deltaproteobacteria bacterium]